MHSQLFLLESIPMLYGIILEIKTQAVNKKIFEFLFFGLMKFQIKNKDRRLFCKKIARNGEKQPKMAKISAMFTLFPFWLVWPIFSLFLLLASGETHPVSLHNRRHRHIQENPCSAHANSECAGRV
jgi:hypothetical protein